MRRTAFALVVAGLLAAAPAAVAAPTVTQNSQFITYANAGAAANLVISDAPSGTGVAVTLTETGIGIGAAPACQDNGNSVTCTIPAPEPPNVDMVLDTGNDKVNASGLSRSRVSIQDLGGEDNFTGGNGTVAPNGRFLGDFISGGDAKDTVIGNGGDDDLSIDSGGGEFVDGGPGNDEVSTFSLQPVASVMRGGTGTDTLWVGSPNFQLVNLTIDLAAGTVVEPGVPTDVAQGFENTETVRGGNNTVFGTNGPNEFLGGPGNDRFVGRLGSDEFQGEGGNDTIEARDGVADLALGGPGSDTCVLDQLDVPSSCDLAQVAAVTPFGATFEDVDPPGCKVGTPGRKGLRAGRVARQGVAVTVDCDEPGRVSARLVGSLRRLRVKGKKGKAVLAKAGDIELASRSARLGGGDKATLRLKVAKRLRKLLRRGVRLRAVVKAVDASGNRMSPRTRRLRLRR